MDYKIPDRPEPKCDGKCKTCPDSSQCKPLEIHEPQCEEYYQ